MTTPSLAKSPQKKEKIFIKTFGCRTNIYDSELIKSYVKDYEIVRGENEADIIIINSCTVTNGADLGLKSYINFLQKNYQAKLILTGCAVGGQGRELFEKNKIHGLLGASEKSRINELLNRRLKFFEPGRLNFIDKDLVSHYENHSKAFVKIQEGCDFACSYCIIPAVRGASRSVAEARLIAQAELLAANGYAELVLTGTNIGSYGRDLRDGGEKYSLARLLKKMGQLRGIKRIRLGSLEPSQLDGEFLELLGEPWMARHLHIALQHSHEAMLRLMRRRNRVRNDLALFEKIASQGYALGTDFILAHPGETGEIWQEALKKLECFPLTHIHAFIFSPRKDTASAMMKDLPQTPPAEAKQRLHTLRELVKKNNLAFRQRMKNTPLELLIEGRKGGYYEGYDQFFNKTRIQSSHDLAKTWAQVDEYEVEAEGNFAKM